MNTAAAEGSGRGNKADDFSHCWFRFKTNLSFFIFFYFHFCYCCRLAVWFSAAHQGEVAWRLWRWQRSSSGIDMLASGPAGGNVPVPQSMKSSRLAKQFPFTSKSLFPPSHNMECFFMYSLSACASLTTRPSAGVGGASTLWIGSGQTQQAKSKGLYSKLEMFPWGLCDFFLLFFFPGAEGICEGMSVKMWASPQN